MGLSCGCDYEWDGESEMYYFPDNYTIMPWWSRRKRCKSCGSIINAGETVTRFDRVRGPLSRIEENIFCDEVPMAPYWLCEGCSDIFFNLTELGFCVDIINDNMHDLLEEYKDEYAQKEAC